MKNLKVINLLFSKLLIFSFLMNSVSCTTLTFKSYGQFPIFFGPKKYHGSIEVFEGEKDYYLWGLIPYEHKVFFDDVLKEYDYISAANIEIEEYQNVENFIFSFLSFGLYVPRNYRVKFYGKK